MTKSKTENAVFSSMKASLEEAIAYERGEAVEAIVIRQMSIPDAADDTMVTAVSQRLLKQNQKALEQLAGQGAQVDEHVNFSTAP